MMKKLLILIAITASTSMFGQYSLDFEDTADYGMWHQGSDATVTEHDAVTNPTQSGLNTSATCIRLTETTGAAAWEYAFLTQVDDANTDPEDDGNGFGFNLNSANGKFIRLKIMPANETAFEIALEPWIAGDDYLIADGADLVSLTGLTLNTWYEIEFDLSGAPEGWVSRVNIRINPTAGNRDGDVYYIDDFAQASTTLSSSNLTKTPLSLFPNPGKDYIELPDFQNYKSISIHNLLGQEVKKMKAAKNLSVSDLTNGIYLLRTDTGATTKFVKK